MSGTVTTVAPAALPADLKNAAVAAVETWLATVTAQANQVKAAVQADLPSVVSTGVSVEALVKAEVAKWKTDVVSVMPSWMKYVAYAAGGVLLLGGGYVVEHVLAKLV